MWSPVSMNRHPVGGLIEREQYTLRYFTATDSPNGKLGQVRLYALHSMWDMEVMLELLSKYPEQRP